jgi:hypothetical protein
MFARLQEFKCTCCNRKFVGAEVNQCDYHPQTPLFTVQESTGTYHCC